jgi:tRNA 2-thiouridine synthesizing protein C
MTKKILFLQSKGPYSTSSAQESLDILLLSSAFAEDISIAFIGDGVLQLKQGQVPAEINAKNFTTAFKALHLYGVEKIYIDQQSLQERQLRLEDLLISGTVLGDQAMAELMATQDAILGL